ncbi:hypothetical protein NHQ30_000194 [Ciborinia camelliae]|nr:hypothetical protein NHQ30_000194 [Ciborinia camelliae]
MVLRIGAANVCFNTSSNGPVGCDGNLGPCLYCGIYGCNSGAPYQPAGYGPPDSVQISTNVPGYTTCGEENPQEIRRYEVGGGTVLCGGPAYRLSFFGDSNSSPSIGHIDFAPTNTWTCTNGSTIQGSGTVYFEIDCTYDSGNNATCVIPDGESIEIPLLAYQIH